MKMKFHKRKVLAAASAGVILAGTMSTVVMAGGKGEYSRLWCRNTVCSVYGEDCQNPGECVNGAECRNPRECVN